MSGSLGRYLTWLCATDEFGKSPVILAGLYPEHGRIRRCAQAALCVSQMVREMLKPTQFRRARPKFESDYVGAARPIERKEPSTVVFDRLRYA